VTSSPPPAALRQDPVFVAGCPRSGTTLLQALLASQSEMATFPETHFFGAARNLDLLNQDLYTLEEASAILDQMETFGRLGIRHEVLSSISKIPVAGKLGQKILFELVLNTLSLKNIRPDIRWIEKTPSNALCLERISSLYPDALFVGIVRDPFNAVHSILRHFPPGGANKCGQTAEFWAINQKKLLKFSEDNPNKIKIIKYEDLSEKPHVILNEICDFLKIPFHPEKTEISNELKMNIVKDFEVWKTSITDRISNNNVNGRRLFKFIDILKIQQSIYPYNEIMGYEIFYPHIQKLFNPVYRVMNSLYSLLYNNIDKFKKFIRIQIYKSKT
jgi:Sulfotransferase family